MIDAEKLRRLVSRLEALDQERAALADDMSEVYKEAREAHLDPKTIKALIAERRRKSKDPYAFEAASELLDDYRNALEVGTKCAHTRVRAREAPHDPVTGEVLQSPPVTADPGPLPDFLDRRRPH